MSAEEMYFMKTMCLAKKTVQMPTKEEHGFLLFCGLGARRWQIGMESNSLTFKQAILNIYPRLRSAIGYNLWTLTKDKKTFERLPEKVNTPRRIRSYLGAQFTGCLIIVPVSDIVLMEERREHLRQMDMKDTRGSSTMISSMESDRLTRSLCLICGKMEKTAGTGSFHNILKDRLPTSHQFTTIAKKLNDILGINVETQKKKFLASEEICKRCLRTVVEIVQMEEKLKNSKEELVSSFFSTTSKYNKIHANLDHSSSASSSARESNRSPPVPAVNGAGNLNFYNYRQQILMPNLSPSSLVGSRGASGYVGVPGMFPLYSGFAAEHRHRSGRIAEGSSVADTAEYRSQIGSDYAGSEVGSSSFISVSPNYERPDYIPTYQTSNTDAYSESVSPRPFDQVSLASTFSLKSHNSSLKSKAQYKDYVDSEDTLVRAPEYPPSEENTEYPPSEEKVEPSPQEEVTESPEADSSSCSPRDGTQDTPNLSPRDAVEETNDRRKPVKKRKRVKETDNPDEVQSKITKEEETDQSPTNFNDKTENSSLISNSNSTSASDITDADT